jgi:hypothetical protein
MKTKRHFLPVALSAMLVILACSEDTPSDTTRISGPANDSDLLNSLQPDSDGGFRPFRLGVPMPLADDRIPQGCEFNPDSMRFFCPPITNERGATVSRGYAFLDQAGMPQSAYDEDLTCSMNVRHSLDASPRRNGRTGSIHLVQDLTASGLEGVETTWTWNGSILERTQGLPPHGPGGPGGPGGHPEHGGPGGGQGGPGHHGPGMPPDSLGPPPDLTVTSSIAVANVVMPHPLNAEAWPLSGTITRMMRIEGGPNGPEERTAVLTFNGTRYVTLDIGDSTITVDLAHPPRPPRPPRDGPPRR